MFNHHISKECDKKMFESEKTTCTSILNSANSLSAEIKSFRVPVYRKTKDCDYVEYYAFNPSVGKLCRKRIKINLIKGTRARKQYANDLITRLHRLLAEGWNPFICSSVNDLVKMADALDSFDQYNETMYKNGLYRQMTYDGYKSYNNIFRQYVQMDEHHIVYLYQMDKRYLTAFLDYVMNVRGCNGTTRNNYLTFLNVFSNYAKERGWIENNPATDIKKISKRLLKKSREVIPTDIIKQISAYCKERDPWMFAACLLLYYCFIRPVEMTRLKIKNVDFENHCIHLNSSQSKNKCDDTVTMPLEVIEFLKTLHLDEFPPDYFIFSNKLKPGPEQRDPVIFRHHWEVIRDALKLPSTFKFYSLKDTGITELAYNKVANINIRDQARHSSLAITDVYTRHVQGRVISELEDYKGSF